MSLTGNATADKLLRGKINGLDVIYYDTYELAVKNGYTGTVEEWLATLEGDKQSQGRSAKYNFTSPGWKRVLNIIRTSGGVVNFGIAQASPLYMSQAAGIVFSGFVKYGDDENAAAKPVIYQLYNNSFGETDAMESIQANITKVRIGYPDPNQDNYDNGTVNAIRNPINCYLDVYVDFDPDALQTGKVAFNMNYSGYADSHNCVSITEETDAVDTGVYGEKLIYSEFSFKRNTGIYAPQINADLLCATEAALANATITELNVVDANIENLPGFVSEAMIGGGYGLKVNSSGYVSMEVASTAQIDTAKAKYLAITPTNVKYAVDKYTADLKRDVDELFDELGIKSGELQNQIDEIKAHIGIGDG